VPPQDATYLLDLFYDAARTDPVVAERFMAAAKAYHTAQSVWRATPTGALAYLVVAVESLVENELPICSECGSHKGVSRAMRDFVFEELPCLREREQEVTTLLKQVYGIRSKHFHTGRFAGGELEPWRDSRILEPAAVALRPISARMDAVVNSLLIAWLVKRATDIPWVRVNEPMPQWKDRQTFSVRVRLGGQLSAR
jgi:hypothetical protein